MDAIATEESVVASRTGGCDQDGRRALPSESMEPSEGAEGAAREGLKPPPVAAAASAESGTSEAAALDSLDAFMDTMTTQREVDKVSA